jgi:exopolysaccharide biosynthesis polyprenyl glycosylphosphotransferase
VSSPFQNPLPPREADLGRLIPGYAPSLRGGKKRPQSARPVEFLPDRVKEISAEGAARPTLDQFGLLLPFPLRRRSAGRWARATATDAALIGLNWLLIGALLVPLRAFFPQVRTFAYAKGAPAFLLGIALLHATLITLIGYGEGLYDGASDLRRETCVLRRSILWATSLLAAAYALQGAPWTTSVLFFGVGALNFVALWTWRWQAGKRQCRLAKCEETAHNVLIVGATGVGKRIAAYVKCHPESGRTICGFLDDDRPLGDGVIGRVCDLARLARTRFVDEVILAPPHDRKLIGQVLREARRLRLNIEIVPELFGCKPAVEAIERVADLPLICLHAERLPSARLIWKRLFDVLGSAVALFLLSPLLAIMAVLTRLDSPGPVFYRAQRAGRKGKPFHCFKFRTMVNNADALKPDLRRNNQRSGPFFKIVNDPRITRLGRFLRRYSLDELPQFWNVLRGEMSLVGPRPHPLDDLAAYDVEHLARLDMKPGMTGLWQVTARRDPSFERSMELDREYIRTWSLTSDLRILLQTVPAVARGSGD